MNHSYIIIYEYMYKYTGGHNMNWSQYERWLFTVKFLSYRVQIGVCYISFVFFN